MAPVGDEIVRPHIAFGARRMLEIGLAHHGRPVDEPELDSLYVHFDDAEFSLGDFELRYRMHHRAGRAIKAVLEGAVEETVRGRVQQGEGAAGG